MPDGAGLSRRWTALLCAAALLLSACDRQPKDDAGVGPGPGAGAATSGEPAGSPYQNQQARKMKLLKAAAGRFGPYGSSADIDAGGEGLPGRDVFDGDSRRYARASAVTTSWHPAWGEERDTPADREALRDALAAVPSARGLKTADVPPPAPPASAERLPAQAQDRAARLLDAGTALTAFENFQRKLEGPLVEVLSRHAWGARAPRGEGLRQNPNRVTVHHTDGHPRTRLTDSIEEMRGYQKFHMDGRGWADIGYHFVIDGSGRVLEGRHAEILGAHAGGGANWDNIGIAVMGDYNKDYLNDAQKNSMRRLITFLALRYHSDPRQRDFIQPHQHYKSTDCPGTHILSFLAELRAGVTKDTLAYLDEAQTKSGSFAPLAVAEP